MTVFFEDFGGIEVRFFRSALEVKIFIDQQDLHVVFSPGIRFIMNPDSGRSVSRSPEYKGKFKFIASTELSVSDETGNKNEYCIL